MGFRSLTESDILKMQESISGPMAQKKFDTIFKDVQLQINKWQKSNDSLDKNFIKKWNTKVNALKAYTTDSGIRKNLNWKLLREKLDFLQQNHCRMDMEYGYKLRDMLINNQTD